MSLNRTPYYKLIMRFPCIIFLVVGCHKKGYHPSVKGGGEATSTRSIATVSRGEGALENPLHEAVAQGNAGKSSLALAPSTNSALYQLPRPYDAMKLDKQLDDAEKTLLHRAVENGDVAQVAQILQTGNYDVDAQDYRGETPLYVAARQGNAAIVNLLLAADAQVTIRDDKMQMPLHASAAQGSVTVVNALLTNHAPVNAEDRYKKISLHYAVANKHVGVIKLLLEAGADVNHQDLDGLPP